MELTVAMVYGQALFDAAQDLNIIDKVSEETQQLRQIFAEEKDFSRLLSNPSVSIEEKKQILKDVFSNQVCEQVLSLLYVLCDKGRFSYFDSIQKEYAHLVEENKGCISGIIYSAKSLTEEQKNKLEEETGKLLGKRVELNNIVDKDLIGGVKIMVEGKVVDASIRGNLDRLSVQLKNA